MNKPVVSVLLPVYNGEKFIEQAVQSILDQTYRNFELMIIDDGSTDRTSAILDQFHDSRIRRMRNTENVGLIRSLNSAAQEAQGTYLARMDADDISLPVRFAAQVEFLETHPEIGVLGTALEQIDSHGRIISTLRLPHTHERIFWIFFFDTAIVHATVMMRSAIFRSAGGYNDTFAHVEDTELWSRLLFTTRFANLQEVLYKRQLHNRSVGSTQHTVQIQTDAAIRKNILKRTIGITVSDAVLRWLFDPSHVLSRSEKEELIYLYFRAYAYMTSAFSLAPEIAEQIQRDVQRRIRIAEHSDCRAMRKFFFRILRDTLPIATRHRLKQSKLGYFLAQRI